MRGAGWTLLSALGTRGVSLVGTLLLTRFLAPDVQGEVTAAFIFVLTPHWATMPLVQYLVARPKSVAGPDVGFHVTVAHLTLGFTVLALAALTSGVAGRYFGVPEMARYAPGFAVALGLERIGTIAERTLARDLRFRPIAVARSASELGYSASSIAFAALGFGGMSIVYGNIVRGLLFCPILVFASNRGAWLTPTPLKLSTFRPIFAFGLPLCVSYLAVIVSRRWDNMVITKMYGPAVAGLYNLAYNLADVPALQVAEQIGDVLMPSLSQLAPGDRKAAVVRVAGLLALLVFPLAVGLGAVAPTIESLFSASWRGVGPMLAVLAAMSITRPIAVSIVGPYLQVEGRTRVVMVLGLAQIALLMGGLLTVGRLGPLWACAAVGIAFALYTLISLLILRALDGVAIGRLLLRCVPPFVASMPMIVAILAFRAAISRFELPGALRLALEITLGAVTYVASAFVVARPLARELVETVRDALRRRRDSDGVPEASS